jgi:hypothetical protein
MRSVPRCYKHYKLGAAVRHPCGGGFGYLHRDPGNRRRWRKGKSQIWDSKIWSWVPRYSDPRKTTLARASSIYKRQTRPLVREGFPQWQDRDCQTVINIWSWAPEDLLIDCPSVAMWLWLWVAVREVLLFSRELLLLEAGSWGRGQFGKSEEGERPPLEAISRKQLKTLQDEKT